MSTHALIIDPDRQRFVLYRELLRAEGIEAEWLDDGLRACAYLTEHSDIRLIVMELSLAGADGFQVLRCLKRSANAGVPVLVASSFREMRKNAIELRAELGIGCVLTTSTPREAFRRTLQRLLRRDLTEEGSAGPAVSVRSQELRRRSLEKAGVLRRDPTTDAALQSIVERVAFEMKVPVALVSVVLETKQWFRAKVGMLAEETPVDASFCRHVVEAKAPLVVADATRHPTFTHNELVREKIVRGYAGAPLIGADGEVWGSLCVIDPKAPLALTAAEVEKLTELAKLVVAEVEASTARSLAQEIEARHDTFEERARTFFRSASAQLPAATTPSP